MKIHLVVKFTQMDFYKLIFLPLFVFSIEISLLFYFEYIALIHVLLATLIIILCFIGEGNN